MLWMWSGQTDDSGTATICVCREYQNCFCLLELLLFVTYLLKVAVGKQAGTLFKAPKCRYICHFMRLIGQGKDTSKLTLIR